MADDNRPDPADKTAPDPNRRAATDPNAFTDTPLVRVPISEAEGHVDMTRSPTLAAGSVGKRTEEERSPLTDVVGSVMKGVEGLRYREVTQPFRPVAALLSDPLREVTRRERRSLLGISTIAILVGSTSLVPQKLESLGITFSVTAQTTLLRLFTWVVVYYTVAFLIYAVNDALTYLHTIFRARAEIRQQRHGTPGRAHLGYSWERSQ